MRGLVTLAAGTLLLAGSSPAGAEGRFEASGFVGIDYFGDNIQLGNSWAAEQVPGTSAMLGARVAYLAIPELASSGRLRLQLAVEAELAIAPAFTSGSFDGGRMSYFAPVFGWRGHAMLRLGGIPAIRPHLLVGAGGATVASTSPFMAKETDAIAYWGVGTSVPVSEQWQIRVDLRHGIMPARDGSATSTLEVQLGLSTSFGIPRKRTPPREPPPPPPSQPEPDHEDTDEDGLPDWTDSCPADAENVNGLDDDDGCPEPDPDGDGLEADDDACPDRAEDFDRFEDDDGCPEPDNDGDGMLDRTDGCPGEPETRNGIEDDDGCPDAVPTALTTAIDKASALTFEPRRSRVTDAAKRAAAPLVVLLGEHAVRIAIVAHPDRTGADDLARQRGDAVKAYLVEQGIAADRIVVEVGDVKRAPIAITLIPSISPLAATPAEQ